MKKLFDIVFISFIILLVSNYLYSQVKADSVKQKYISPKSAMIRSAIIPGWGQWSNGKKIKSIAVASIEGYLLYNFVDYWKKYNMAVNEENEQDIELFRNERSKYGWWLFLGHILSLMDAYVDAYLTDFNKNMDINYSTNSAGLIISFKF